MIILFLLNILRLLCVIIRQISLTIRSLGYPDFNSVSATCSTPNTFYEIVYLLKLLFSTYKITIKRTKTLRHSRIYYSMILYKCCFYLTAVKDIIPAGNVFYRHFMNVVMTRVGAEKKICLY